MKRILTIFLSFLAFGLNAQGTYCNMNGNLMIFTNYDGGALNINVNVNIPNLKIGVVTYEACQITLSGTYVGNVTGVVYAGYSGSNNHCSTGTTTSITGAPASATKSILFAPTSPITNSNGYGSIICGYSCSTTSSQGGCNTIDQIEAYMLGYFSNSTLYAHRVQYGCWSGSQSISAGGDCCASITTLTLTSLINDESCPSKCDGSVIPGAAGGTSPYTYTLNGLSNLSGLCSSSYVLKVTDASLASKTDTITVGSGGPTAPTGDSIQTFCGASIVDNLLATGNSVKWYDTDTSSTSLDSNTSLVNGKYYYATRILNGCESSRFKVKAVVLAGNLLVTNINKTLSAVASGLSYQWINCQSGQAIGGATQQSFTPVANGSYAVIIVENGCADTSECIDVVGVGIAGRNESPTLKIFPNPADDRLMISSNSDNLSIVEIRTRNIAGALVEVPVLSGNGKVIILNTSSLNSGLYFIEISTSKGVEFARFSKK